MNVLDLFSGIGGFSLGLERAGLRTVAFCEIDPYCRAVLRKRWPGVPIYDDVKALTGERLRADGIGQIDVICGGFPCQDISVAGKGAGLEGERSGLWSEFRRLIEEVRPAFALIENVSALRSRGLDRVLGEIAALGYDAEWHCIPASAVGAPHRRDRVWIVACPGRDGGQSERKPGVGFGATSQDQGREEKRERVRAAADNGGEDVAHADIDAGEPRWGGDAQEGPRGRDACGSRLGADDVADTPRGLLNGAGGARPRRRPELADGDWWESEPDVGRVAHGVPSRVDRLRALGNAVVPQIPEILGRMIQALA